MCKTQVKANLCAKLSEGDPSEKFLEDFDRILSFAKTPVTIVGGINVDNVDRILRHVLAAIAVGGAICKAEYPMRLRKPLRRRCKRTSDRLRSEIVRRQRICTRRFASLFSEG